MLESEDFFLGHSLAAMNSQTGLGYILGGGGGNDRERLGGTPAVISWHTLRDSCSLHGTGIVS